MTGFEVYSIDILAGLKTKPLLSVGSFLAQACYFLAFTATPFVLVVTRVIFVSVAL